MTTETGVWAARTVEWDLSGYRPHEGQKPFHRSTARFRILACGRRWGKDRACIFEELRLIPRFLARNQGKGLVPPVLVWNVAPTYPLSEQSWSELLAYLPKGAMEKVSESERMVRLVGGAEIWMKTAVDPQRLVSVGLDLVYILEAGLIDHVAWEEALRPTLSSYGRAGMAIINGTPKGRNWFHDIYLRGQDELEADYASWNYPTWEAYWLREDGSREPLIPTEEIEEARRTLPDETFRQEYGAEFLDNVGFVFRNVDNCVAGELSDPQEGRRYIFGVDLAKHQDFTVVVGADAVTRRVVYFDRFSRVDWAVTKPRIVEALRRYNNGRAVVDATGVGDPIVEDLQRMGLAVEGYHMTATSKRQLVDGLAVSLEQERIRFPRIDQLINELKAYQYETTKAGNLKMAAPKGYYDDCVVALGLCVHGLTQYGSASLPGPEKYATYAAAVR